MLVSVTVWGERCVPLFTGPVLDSHADALRRFDGEVRYMVHADDPAVAKAIALKTGKAVECRPVVRESATRKLKNDHATLKACQFEAIAAARPGEALVLLNADLLVSVECFAAIWHQVAAGKKMVICCATRTRPQEWPKRQIQSAELLSWGMRNAHTITRECYYGSGTIDTPWAIYFRCGTSTVLRGFHLHPLAVVNDRALKFEKSVDWDLASCFAREDIHVVTGKDELALAEVSPAAKPWQSLGRPFGAQDILSWTRRKTIDFHWWLFSQRILIEGEDRDCGDCALHQALMACENRTLQAA